MRTRIGNWFRSTVIVAALYGAGFTASAAAAQDCAPMADSTCHCPPGTEYATDPDGGRELGYTQGESIRIEYCRKRLPNGSWVRQGPCIYRGPNDERYEQGQYVDGQRDGIWRHWGTSQTSEHLYRHGQYIGTVGELGYPESVFVDFCNCRAQSGLTYWSLGSSWWRVRGAIGDTCIVSTGGEIEGGYGPSSIFHVPRALGRVKLSKTTRNWTLLTPFLVGTEGKGGNLMLDLRRAR